MILPADTTAIAHFTSRSIRGYGQYREKSHPRGFPWHLYLTRHHLYIDGIWYEAFVIWEINGNTYERHWLTPYFNVRVWQP